MALREKCQCKKIVYRDFHVEKQSPPNMESQLMRFNIYGILQLYSEIIFQASCDLWYYCY